MMKLMCGLGVILAAGGVVLADSNDVLVNVGLAEWGSSATASSEYGPGYEAENAIDGKWAVRETDKWNSASGKGPHWLLVDLGQVRKINRVVIHHETGGAITSDFHLQKGETPDGSWIDLVAPVKGNTNVVSIHEFPLVESRFVRLLITKAEQGGNEYGRIFEFEVFSPEKPAVARKNPLVQAETLARLSHAGKLTDEQVGEAAGLLDNEDIFVRALAEWAISQKVGQDNNTENVVWPKRDAPDWYRKWTAIPLDSLVQMEWVRQAVSLKIHNSSSKLLESVDALLDRAGKLTKDVKGSSERLGKVEKQISILKEIRDRMKSQRSDSAAVRKLWIEARRAMRPIVFSNPAVDFDQVTFYTRYGFHYKPNVCGVHVGWAYKPGGDICVLSGLESGAKVKTMINGQLGPGHVHGMDLWFEGDRFVFGWANQQKWPPIRPTTWPRHDNACFAFELREDTEPPHLYEIRADGKGVTQLTDHNYWTDIEPVYCPDGSIAFTSDRSAHSPSCDSYNNDLTDHNLYLLTKDRQNIRRLTNQKDVDMHPHLLDNGLIAYLRWEYIERHFWNVHSVWTVKPDGTMADALFKQHLNYPLSVRDARSIPGSTKMVAIAAGHHCLPIGPVVLLNPGKGRNDEGSIELLTEGPRPQEGAEKRTWNTNIVKDGGVVDAGGYYQTPYALSEKCYLVSYAYTSQLASRYGSPLGDIDSNGAGIYLIDSYGNKELVFRDPLYCAVSPMPFGKRKAPPVIPDATDYSKNYATCLVPDVYEGMDGVEKGEVKYIRLMEELPWPVVPGEGAKRWFPQPIWGPVEGVSRWCPVRVIGTVPVDEDGSANFKVPVADNACVYFQALDKNHMEVRRMRTSVSFQPGERRSCNGCHETNGKTPEKHYNGSAARREPDMPQAPEWGCQKALGYEWLVQPVLDKHCVSCHGSKEPKGNLDFTAGKSYHAICGKSGLVSISNRLGDGGVSKVKEFGSHKSKLILSILNKTKGHEDVKLAENEWIALVTWVDANAPAGDKMLSKRTKDGRKDVWELFPWKDPWVMPIPVPAKGEKVEKLKISADFK